MREKVSIESAEKVERGRVNSLILAHSVKYWWLYQPFWVCRKLKEFGVYFNKVIDIGCGDGRWTSGIKENYPDATITGIDFRDDCIEFLIDVYPHEEWIVSDFNSFPFDQYAFDTALFGGTFNPTIYNPEKDDPLYEKMILRTVNLYPYWIIVLYDKAKVHYPFYNTFSRYYDIKNSFPVQDDLQDTRQQLEVICYQIKNKEKWENSEKWLNRMS